MKKDFSLSDYLEPLLAKDEEAIAALFMPGAEVVWHNTGESFTPREFARVNAAYPGSWKGEAEYELRVESSESVLIIAACRIFSPDTGESHHAVSFIRVRGGLIERIDEYWGEDGEPPEWRRALTEAGR